LISAGAEDVDGASGQDAPSSITASVSRPFRQGAALRPSASELGRLGRGFAEEEGCPPLSPERWPRPIGRRAGRSICVKAQSAQLSFGTVAAMARCR
jgi:hypothetical protein